MTQHDDRRRLQILCGAIVSMAFLFCTQNAGATYGDTSTYLGTPYDGDGGAATAALLDFPDDVASDSFGNLYLADTFDHAIRKIDTSGIITTLAGGLYGFADGQGTAAAFAYPRGVAADASGNIYVADTTNNAVRKITALGAVTTLVSSGLNAPYGVAVSGSTVFIADSGSNALKSVSTSGGTVTTLTASLNDPRKLAATADGSTVYIADNGNHRVVAVSVATGIVTVIAGSGDDGYQEGTGLTAKFQNVLGVALDASETRLYVSEADLYLTDRIRTIDLPSGATALFAVDTTQTTMIFPAGMTVSSGNLYVAMSGLGIIRRFSTSDASNTAVAAGTDRFGSRDGTNPLFGRPSDLAISNDRQYLYITENNRIVRVALASKSASSVIGSVVDNYREGVPVGAGATNLDEARFSGVSGIAVNSTGTALYVADRWNNRIRKVDLTVTPFRTSLVTGAGRYNGTGDTTNGYQEGTRCTQTANRNDSLTLQAGCAYLWQPTTVVLDPTETYLYVADTGNDRIRKVRISDGQTTLIAGSTAGYADGIGASAKFHAPWGMALSDDGKTLYVADRDNHRIRKINLETNAVTTLAGSGSAGYREGIGTAAYFSFPRRIKMGADGNLYLTEAGAQRIRLLDPRTGLTKLVSGSGTRGYVNGAATTAAFNGPAGLAPVTGSEELYVADSSNDVLRLISIPGTAPYTDLAPTVTSVRPDEVDKDWDKGTGLKVKIVGTGFRHGAIVKFYKYQAIKTYVLSSKELVAQLPLSKMSPGWFDITVTNVDGQSAFLEAGLAVRGADDSVPGVFYSVSDSLGILAYTSTFRAGFFAAAGNVWGDERDEIIAGTAKGLGPQVRIYSNTGVLRGQFFAYASTWRTGVRVASCDVNGDGVDEIVTVPGPGARPRVKIFNRAGKAVATSGFYVLNSRFTGGTNLACGDVDGNGRAEIIVAAAKGGGPYVGLYQANGKKTGQFRAAATTFRGGLMLGVYDRNGDRKDEIITAPESGVGRVGIYNNRGQRLLSFYPFVSSYTGGVNVAGGDTNDDGRDELILAPRSGAQGRVKVYRWDAKVVLSSFLAYPRAYTGGVVVASGDLNGDGVDDVLTAPAAGFAPSYRMFHQSGKPLALE